MEISSEERVKLSIVVTHPDNGDAGVEEDHLWPTKDGPLPIFLKVSISHVYCLWDSFHHTLLSKL